MTAFEMAPCRYMLERYDTDAAIAAYAFASYAARYQPLYALR